MVEEFIEKEHEKLVRILKSYLEKDGYVVKIKPETNEYAGVKADMEATKGKEVLCIEVINGKEINTSETKKKWEAISGNRESDFSLFVTKEKEEQVKKLLEEWAIYFRKIWTYNSKAI